MAGTIEARIKALDLVLPEPKSAIATYVPFVHTNGQLLISGQLPMKDGSVAATGQLGRDVALEAGQDAAKLCALNILAQAKTALGELDRITQLLRLNGFVSAAPGFADHPKVINGASDFLVDVFGEKGKHARSAVGMNALPGNIAVEIEMIVEVED